MTETSLFSYSKKITNCLTDAMISSMQQEKSKTSFEFKMSKKVAELSLVVQMLFTRNHEKGVEMEALKKSYEHEIELILKDAKEHIEKLTHEVSDLRKQNVHGLQQVIQVKEHEMKAKEIEWRHKMAQNEQLLQDERNECRKLRDLLISAHRDIEKLRQEATQHSDLDEVKKDKEIEKLRVLLATADGRLKDAQDAIAEQQMTNDKLEREVKRLQTEMGSINQAQDQLVARNKQLDNDTKALKRELNRTTTNQIRNRKNVPSEDTSQELEKLRAEVQRYRLELSNRDHNFNRMFTDRQPILVHHNGGGTAQKMFSNTMYAFSHSNGRHNSFVCEMSSQEDQTDTTYSPVVVQERKKIINSHKSFDKLSRSSNQEHSLEDNADSIKLYHNKGLRPHNEGSTFVSEGLLNKSGRHLMTIPQLLCPDKKTVGIQNTDRPDSSNLPSVSSTPQRSHLSSQLTRPQRLSREMFNVK